MTELTASRIALPTGVTLNVQTGGARGGEAIVFLHGFPESHRTWREIAPALADALALDRFTLVGHDWGGAVAWLAALHHPDRLRRLVIVNAPHPLVFQKSLIEDPAQRAASQYITAFRNPGMERALEAMGLETFYAKTFASHADIAKVPDAERQAYLDDWSAPGALTAMLNWYRASEVVVPAVGEDAGLPVWTTLPFPKIAVPTLVVWAMRDTALLPVQLEGLDDLVEDLTVVRIPDAGHFVPWEKPGPVLAAIGDFMRRP